MELPRLERVAGLPLPLLRGERHPCPYLPGRVAAELFVASIVDDSQVYQLLLDHGFRRAGLVCYRPACPDCQACVPIRIPVRRFSPSRSQRRVLRRNADVQVEITSPSCDDEHWDLFCRYQRWQHDGRMIRMRDEFRRFLCVSPIETIEMSYRLDGRLVGAGIVDVCPQGLSSVYMYYEPDCARRSLGVFSGLCEIEECRRRGLPYWHLGYWIAGCRSMEYKNRFRPYELLTSGGEWTAP